MQPELIETLVLENGLNLQILDASVKMTADRWRVVIMARIDIPVDTTSFSEDTEQDLPLEQIRLALGDTVRYEYSSTRNFVDDAEKHAVFDEMKKQIHANAQTYYARRLFIKRFVLKQYEDKRQKYGEVGRS